MDISNVRDGQPRIISKKNTYQHIPLTLKYCFIDKRKIDFYLKTSGINQFRENIISVYTYNNSTQTNKQNEHSVLLVLVWDLILLFVRKVRSV